MTEYYVQWKWIKCHSWKDTTVFCSYIQYTSYSMYDFFKMGLAVGSTRVPWWQETDVLLDFDQTRTSLVFEWNISGFCCLFEDWIIVSEKENNLIHQHNCDKRSLSFVCITSKSVTLWFIQSVCVFFVFLLYSTCVCNQFDLWCLWLCETFEWICCLWG